MSENSQPDFWQMQSELDIQGLVDALSADDKLIRQRAAAAIRSMKAVAALPALQSAYKSEEDPETSMAIATAIESLTDQAQGTLPTSAQNDLNEGSKTQRLINKLKSEVQDDVAKAATQLGDHGDKLAVEALILAFNNPKHTIHVRLAIAEALLKLESAPATVALLANLRHTDWHIRRNGAAILGQLQAEWAIDPLAQSLADPHPVVRRTALAALKHIGTPESRKALAKFMQDDAKTSATTKSTPKEVSGIEVKRPGQSRQDADGDKSSLLKRLGDENDDVHPSRVDTQPLRDPNMKKQIEATQPIRDNMLDQLDVLLSGDDSDDDDDE